VLALEEMRLVPCALPPHRTVPGVTAEHRLAMLEAAVALEFGLQADDCELQRQVAKPEIPSYTIDTLSVLREQLGEQTKICLCIGMDSLVNLSSWHRWQDLLNFAHIIVAARPGWRWPAEGEVAQLIKRCGVSSAEQVIGPYGKVWCAEMTQLPVSSTEIRCAIKSGNSIAYLLPEKVIDYIRKHQLYVG